MGSVSRVGFLAGIAAFAATVAFVVVQTLQLLLASPWAVTAPLFMLTLAMSLRGRQAPTPPRRHDARLSA